MLIIKEVCKRLGVTSKELADRLGVTQPAISKYLNGNPTAERIEAIAIALGVPVGDLFSDSKERIHGYIKADGALFEIRNLEDLTRLAERLSGGRIYPADEDLEKLFDFHLQHKRTHPDAPASGD